MPNLLGPEPFEQHAYECTQHPACTVIVGFDGGRPIWESHMPATVSPAVRINIDYPEVHDKTATDPARHEVKTWRLAEPSECEQLGWDEDTHLTVAYTAHRKGLITAEEAVAKIDAVSDVTTFHELAEAKKLHEPFDGQTPARLKKP